MSGPHLCRREQSGQAAEGLVPLLATPTGFFNQSLLLGARATGSRLPLSPWPNDPRPGRYMVRAGTFYPVATPAQMPSVVAHGSGNEE